MAIGEDLQSRFKYDQPKIRSLWLLLFFVSGLVLVALAILWVSGGELQGHDVVTLFVVLLSGAIAIASTTFIGNFMAGTLLGRIANFSTGDWLSVGEHFGKVSAIGLLRTQIQTEDSDLINLPNLYLVTNPTKVIRKKKTVVSASVSLGYDVPRAEVERVLQSAAK